MKPDEVQRAIDDQEELFRNASHVGFRISDDGGYDSVGCLQPDEDEWIQLGLVQHVVMRSTVMGTSLTLQFGGPEGPEGLPLCREGKVTKRDGSDFCVEFESD